MPTYREMAKMFGVASTSGIAFAVNKWVNAGIMKIEDKKLTPTSEFFGLPLLGSIQAGLPNQEESSLWDFVSLEDLLYKVTPNTFALKVRGDSMIDEGIKDGDLVVLDNSKEPRNGSIVAAFVDREWTLKYFYKENGKVSLKAANKNYKAIQPKEELNLGGVVVNVIRSYQ